MTWLLGVHSEAVIYKQFWQSYMQNAVFIYRYLRLGNNTVSICCLHIGNEFICLLGLI
jgi:hypothetical protein